MIVVQNIKNSMKFIKSNDFYDIHPRQNYINGPHDYPNNPYMNF